jgi:hypothetical protein
MSLSQFIGLIPSFIGVFGGIAVAAFTAFFSIRIYRRQKEIDRKGAAYEKYLAAHADYRRLAGVKGQETKFDDARLKYSRALVALFPVASDEVIEAAMKFYNFAEQERPQPEGGWDTWIESWKSLYATMIYAMRRDVFVESTELDADRLAALVPWYFDLGGEKTPQEPPQGLGFQNNEERDEVEHTRDSV